MNLQAFKAELSHCQEPSGTQHLPLTKGERYLLNKVFYPFSADPDGISTDGLDFSAFTEEELIDMYQEIEEYIPWFSNIACYTTVTENIAKAKPHASKSVFI